MLLTRSLRRAVSGLRFRMLVPLAVGVLLAGLGFEALLLELTRGWLYEELDARSQSIAGLLAERSLEPLLTGNAGSLGGEIQRLAAEPDVAGGAIYRADGSLAAASPGPARPWTEAGPPSGALRSPLSRWRRFGDRNLIEVTAPVVRRAPVPAPMGAGTDGASTPAVRGELIGWVRVIVSPRRLEQSVASAGQLGLMVLLAALGVGLLGVVGLGRQAVRPLHEATELAREIAAGRLDRRLPVRGDDELSRLAEAMNTVAGALLEARQRVEAESNALRTASRAVMTIARGTRVERDPDAMFGVVAVELRRVTGCDAVALAVPREDDHLLHFAHFDPPPPWGGIGEGMVLDSGVLLDLRVPDGSGTRLALDGDADPLSRGLAGDGFGSAMLVPLTLDAGPQAVLLLASRQLKAFPPGRADIAAGLATHLSAALHVTRLDDQLRSAVGELQQTHEYLAHSEMLRVAGEMATGVAHEINNLLGSVLGRTQLLNLRLTTGRLTPEELATSLRVIERAALDGSEIGRRLRQFGRGVTDADPEPVALDRVLLDAIEFTRPRWENEALVTGRRIEVTRESWAGAWVMGRSNELREVFTNIILNSVDALPEGGSIRLAAQGRGDRVIVRIQDDGIGMDEETRRHAFEPFFTTKGERGSGLGLSVAYGILTRHGASIEIESQPGQGTTVLVSLPRAGEAPREVRHPGARPGGPQALRVMVVDDDQGVREVLSDMLAALGHAVRSFASGEEALRDFRAGLYDLVLTDLGMPGITGWKLSRMVRDADPAVVVAFVTGWGDEVRPELLERAGVGHVVTKPFTLEDIVAVTAQVGPRPAADARRAA